MPEGDTVWLSAQNLDAALGGELLTVCDLRVPAFATVDLSGTVIDEVVSRGKHLLHHVGEFTIHSHLKMEGSWHLYQHGTPWRRPAFSARAVLETGDWVSVGFSLGELEVVPRDQEDTVVGHLGPDLLGEDWDADLAVANIRSTPDVAIFVALLDQRNLAGLGNEYVNELCFLKGVLPTRAVSSVNVASIVALGHRLINANKTRSIRATTGDLRPGKQTWVYPRAGNPCRRCGTRILRGTLGPTPLVQRDTYWCPRCQS